MSHYQTKVKINNVVDLGEARLKLTSIQLQTINLTMKGIIEMKKQETWHGPAHYQIKVKGLLGNQWTEWFEGMTIKSKGNITTITGKVVDQSALHGLLVRVRDLGLPLISVNRIEL